MNEWKVTFETPAFQKSLSPVRTQFFHKVKVIFKALVLLLLFFFFYLSSESACHSDLSSSCCSEAHFQSFFCKGQSNIQRHVRNLHSEDF